MRKRNSKICSFLLALLLGIGLLGGCGNDQQGQPSQSNTADDTPSDISQTSSDIEGLTLPIVTEPITLTYFVGMNPNVSATMTSYNEIAAYKQKEKDTGIHIEFLHPPIGQENEQFSLMLSSQDYADIIEWNWRGVSGGPEKAIEDGVIIQLNDFVDQYAPNLKKILGQNAEAAKQVVTDSGKMYAFPFLRLDPYLTVFTGFQIRKDWLDRLGLQIPGTVDEWYNVLKEFKQKDANGNGDPNDEIPFVATGGLYVKGLQAWLYPWGITSGFYQEGQTVKYGPMQPEYKEFLLTMRKWFNEGLLDPDFVTTNDKLFDSKITGDKAGAFFGYAGSNMRRYMDLVTPQNPNFKIAAAPYPALKAGDKPKLGQMDSLYPGINSAAISLKNKYQEESVKWLDYNYSEQGHMLFNFGIEGESYVMENGYPKYTDKITKNPEGLAFSNAAAQYTLSSFGGPFVQDKRYMEQYMSTPDLKNAIELWMQPDHSRLLPPITPTQEESAQLSSIMNEINTYRGEMFNKFIMGQEPIENFDNYVQNLKSMGIDDAIKMEQAALDRYTKR